MAPFVSFAGHLIGKEISVYDVSCLYTDRVNFSVCVCVHTCYVNVHSSRSF